MWNGTFSSLAFLRDDSTVQCTATARLVTTLTIHRGTMALHLILPKWLLSHLPRPTQRPQILLNGRNGEGTVKIGLLFGFPLSHTFACIAFEFQHSKDRQLLPSVAVWGRPVRPRACMSDQFGFSPIADSTVILWPASFGNVETPPTPVLGQAVSRNARHPKFTSHIGFPDQRLQLLEWPTLAIDQYYTRKPAILLQPCSSHPVRCKTMVRMVLKRRE